MPIPFRGLAVAASDRRALAPRGMPRFGSKRSILGSASDPSLVPGPAQEPKAKPPGQGPSGLGLGALGLVGSL